MLSLKTSRRMANAVHPVVILLLISLSWLLSLVLHLSQVSVAFNVNDLSVVDLYWCVVFHNLLCLRLVHIQTMIFTFIS